LLKFGYRSFKSSGRKPLGYFVVVNDCGSGEQVGSEVWMVLVRVFLEVLGICIAGFWVVHFGGGYAKFFRDNFP
jgi:hypothetical protein